MSTDRTPPADACPSAVCDSTDPLEFVEERGPDREAWECPECGLKVIQ